MSASSFFWSLFFGSIGLGFFIYGKKQTAMVPMVCGLALMIFPYFISSVPLMLIIGTAFVAVPYFFRN